MFVAKEAESEEYTEEKHLSIVMTHAYCEKKTESHSCICCQEFFEDKTPKYRVIEATFGSMRTSETSRTNMKGSYMAALVRGNN